MSDRVVGVVKVGYGDTFCYDVNLKVVTSGKKSENKCLCISFIT